MTREDHVHLLTTYLRELRMLNESGHHCSREIGGVLTELNEQLGVDAL